MTQIISNNHQQSQLFNQIIIIGLGLVGGSIAKICKNNLAASKILGFDIDKSQQNLAVSKKIIDETYNFNQKINNDDLIIIATPLSCYEEIFQKIAPNLSENTLIIDIGSIKNFTLDLSEKFLEEKSSKFIACHPIAGSEKSGVKNADEKLFLNKKVIISVSKNNTENVVNKIGLFWKKIGLIPQFIDAERHDKIFSLTSHLPQFLSFITKEEYKNGDNKILDKHFRLQDSNPKIWQEIFSLNYNNIKYYLEFYLENLDLIINWLEKNEYNEIIKFSKFNTEEKPDYDNNLNYTQNYIERIILVSCFLNLPNIEEFKPYYGNGFKDFTAIILYAKNLTPQILEQNRENLTKFLKQIKSNITQYEFI
jgi:prephenate dehydrogenase